MGGYTDGETGLVLFGHRYYDPQTGRWLTRDPMGYARGLDLYAYTQNNPVNRADPSGYQEIQGQEGGPGNPWGDGQGEGPVETPIIPDGADPPGGTPDVPPAPSVPPDTTVTFTGEPEGETGSDGGALSTWANPSTVADHFGRHGPDLGVTNIEEYAQMANDFWNARGNPDIQELYDPDENVCRLYQGSTGLFGVYTENGGTVTFYAPPGGQGYFDRQPGYPVIRGL